MIFYSILIFSLLVITAFWLWFYIANRRIHLVEITNKKLPPVTVIIAYKNAGHHIATTVQAVLDQKYPDFEVIAINDFSSDESESYLSHINDAKLIRLRATLDLAGKKAALSEAISHAKHEILLFTDADCLPSSELWIKTMVTKLLDDPKTEVVLGYGPLRKTAGLVNAFARYETILTAMQYFTYAKCGLPYMGVGRNLLYKKSLFLAVNGFSSHQHLPSGDDDLLISDAANGSNTAVCLDDRTFVFSDAKNDLKAFLHQKSRHITTSVHYRPKIQFLLGLFAMVQLMVYLILMTSLTTNSISFISCIAILSVKWFTQMACQYHFFKRLNGRDLWLFFPLLDLAMMMYYLVLPVYGYFRKDKW